MSAQEALALPLPAASNTVVINARCTLRIEAGQRVIVVAGLPMHHYRAEDAIAEAYAMVFLVESGFAQQTDVERAFARFPRAAAQWCWWCGRCATDLVQDSESSDSIAQMALQDRREDGLDRMPTQNESLTFAQLY